MKKPIFLLLILLQSCFSMVVVNSLDGRDVVSCAYYAAIAGEEFVFVPPAYDQAAVYGKVGAGQDVLLVQSAENPAIPGMAEDLRNRGNDVEVVLSSEPYATNLELARRSGASSFILSDPVYGYNTVSALAYARLNSMYLVFVDRNNADSVAAFLRQSSPRDVLAYGYMDGYATDALSGNGVEYREINNGDKFDDNLELAGLYMGQNPSANQVILSDGNAIEDTIAVADTPVILISPLIPQPTYDFIKANAASGRVPIALVVDQEYAQTAYNLKESINRELGAEALHVFVKVGEGSSDSGSQMASVDFFPLPGPRFGLGIARAEYNKATKELEVTYENTGNALEYVKGRIIVFVDGSQAAVVGDEEAFALARGWQVGRSYPVEIEEGQITANITALFGSSKKSLENGINTVVGAGTVEVTDDSSLNITGFRLDKQTMDLYVTFSNSGGSPVYFSSYISAIVNGRVTKLEDEQVYLLSVGEDRVLRFPGIAKEGAAVTAGAKYGSREAFLEKTVEKEYTPESGPDIALMGAGILALVILLAAAYFLFVKKK